MNLSSLVFEIEITGDISRKIPSFFITVFENNLLEPFLNNLAKV